LKKEGWYQGVAKKEFTRAKLPLKINGDLRQMAGGADSEEDLELQVVTAKADGKQLEGDPNSPVILLGDSHTLVFQAGGDLHAKGAGLFDHLSAKLGFAVDLLGVRGSGVTPARIKLFQRAKQDGELPCRQKGPHLVFRRPRVHRRRRLEGDSRGAVNTAWTSRESLVCITARFILRWVGRAVCV
jgi:hypothetical protein